jgi:methionine synthase I (cobalamin-dependent)
MVADGAMGTMLYSRGVFINRCFDELNLSSPDMVRQIHQEYVKAGAEILETNTFGATRQRLAAFGVAEKLREINLAGVKLAREAAKESAFVAGAIGPLGVRIEPLGPTSFAEARAGFREQIDALLEAGVDLLIFETFGNLDELREGVLAAREAAGNDMVVIAQVTIDDFGHLPGGTDTEKFTRELDSWPVDVIGLNCSVGPKATLETIERMMQYSAKPMSAMPNAGLPMRIEGRNIYLCSPEYMAQYARRLLWAGVKVIGGCCGTTPDHIKLIRSETRSLQPLQKKLSVTVEEPKVKAQALTPVPMAEKSKVGAKLAAGARFDCMEAVYGVGPESHARQAFVNQLHDRMLRVRRGRDKPLAIFEPFGSKPDGDFDATEPYLLDNLAKVDKARLENGLKWDYYAIEFWHDAAADLSAPNARNFPNGFAKTMQEIRRQGMKPGLWIDSGQIGGWTIWDNPALKHARTSGGGL